MNKFKIFFIIVISIGLLALSKAKNFGLLLEAPLLTATFLFMVKYRKSLANWFRTLPLPTFIVAVISSLPFMLFEENTNCLPIGCRLIPSTIPFLTVSIIILCSFVMFLKVKNISKPLIVFSILGVFFEMTFGVSAAEFRVLPLLWMAFMILWVGLSYAYIALVSVTILTEKNKGQKV